MKIQAITWKWVNLLLLLLALLGYQYVQAGRAAAEEAAKLQNEIDILTVEKEEMQEALVLLKEAAQGGASGAAQTGDGLGSAVSDDGAASGSEGGGGTASDSGDGAEGYADGVRQGTAMGFGGDITVEVTVKDGVMQEISVVQAEFEDKEYMDMAIKMIPEMIETGSPEVDAVTGATLSSIGLRDAVQAALQAGMQ